MLLEEDAQVSVLVLLACRGAQRGLRQCPSVVCLLILGESSRLTALWMLCHEHLPAGVNTHHELPLPLHLLPLLCATGGEYSSTLL